MKKVCKNNPSYVKLKLTREGKKNDNKKKRSKKQELIKQLVSKYGVESIADIQNSLKDLLGSTIEELLYKQK